MTEPQSVAFRFQLSDWTLFTVRRSLDVRAYKIGDPPLTMEQLPLPSLGTHGLMLRSVPITDVCAGIHWRVLGQQRLLVYVLQTFPRYFIDLGQSFEDYKAKFSGKTRSTLQRKVRKFADHCGGAIRWEQFSRPEQLARFWQLARQVSTKTYQERLLDAGLPDDPAYKAEAHRLAEADNLRAYLLFDGELPVSYLFCPIDQGVVQYAYLGYDPKYLKLSVGTVLQWLALETLFAEQRYKYFDFTEGASDHKRMFATAHMACANVALLRPTLTNRLLAHGHRAFVRAVELLGSWLERHELKTRIRHLLRFGRAGT